jgi:Tol biopolymer transport system component
MSKRFFAILAILAVGCIGVLSCRPVGSTPLETISDAERVAFLTNSSSPSLFAWGLKKSIQVMNIHSPGLNSIIQDEGIQWGLDWSPDGNYIVYFDNAQNLYKVAIDGSQQPELLLQKAYGAHPSWSPDGLQIAYAGSGDIYLLRLADKQTTSLLGKTTKGTHPDWSPDGNKIVFTQNPVSIPDGPPSSIAVMNTDGTGLVQLTPDDGSNFPKWSPDGKKILFQRANNLYTMNSDGSNVRILSEDGKSYMADWSFDGTRIIYLSDVNQDCGLSIADGPRFCTNEVRVMNDDGSNIVVLRNEKNERYMSPVWSPHH